MCVHYSYEKLQMNFKRADCQVYLWVAVVEISISYETIINLFSVLQLNWFKTVMYNIFKSTVEQMTVCVKGCPC